jgi:hypothetical protein
MTFSVYPVSSSQAFLVEIDDAASATSSTPYLSLGSIRTQVGYPFPTSLSGGFGNGTSVGALSGQYFSATSNNYVPDVAVIAISTSSGSGNLGVSLTENRAGTVSNASASSATFIQGDQYGRVAIQGLDQQISPAFYTINGNQAFCIGGIESNPFFGIVEPQSSGPFSAATIKGSFIQGTFAPSLSSVPNISGVISFDGVSAVTGTENESASSRLTITGSYQLTSTGATDGSGTMALTSPATFNGAFYIVSPSEVVMVSTTAGDNNPRVIIIGHE